MSLKRLTMFLTLEDRQDKVIPICTVQVPERSAKVALTEDLHQLSHFEQQPRESAQPLWNEILNEILNQP